MNPRPSTAILASATLALVLLSAGAGAQAQGGLLYTTLSAERSSQCATAGAITNVRTEDVQYVAPRAAGPYSSMAFATQVGYCQLLGDFDGDSDYWEGRLFQTIDALVRPRDVGGAPLPVDVHSLFLSAGGSVSSPAGTLIHPADVFRVLPGGVLEFFLTEAQIRTAFGFAAAGNVDAAALSFDPQLGGIFLSFNNSNTAYFGTTLFHEILRIPMSALTLTASPHDGAVLVAAVAPNSGMMQYPLATLNAMVVASGVSDSQGAAVSSAGDIDGLTWNEQAAELWFSGQRLWGAAVLSTRAGGNIAVLNGRPLGQTAPAPTTGTQVGLVPPSARLNGLALASGVSVFVTDTQTANANPGLKTVATGGAPPGAPVWLLLNLVLDAPGGPPDPRSAFANPGFPWLYPFLTHVGPVFAGPDGCMSVTGGPAPSLPGWHVTAQALTLGLTGTAMLSTPTVIDM